VVAPVFGDAFPELTTRPPGLLKARSDGAAAVPTTALGGYFPPPGIRPALHRQTK